MSGFIGELLGTAPAGANPAMLVAAE